MGSPRLRRLSTATAVMAAAALLLHPVAAFASPVAQAEDDPMGDISWSIQPSSAEGPDGRDALIYTLGLGESVTDYIGVSNLGDESLTVQVYAMDAIMTADGAFSLPPAASAPTDLGSWVGFSGDGMYTIEPGTRIDIPFLLTVPENASPGDHAAGIVASVTTAAGSDNAAPNMSVDRRVGVRMYLSIPGDVLPAVDVTDVAVSHQAGWSLHVPATIEYTVRNTGNVRVRGTATITTAAPWGSALSDPITVDLPDLLPGAEVTLSAEVPQVGTAGIITGAVDLAPQTDQGTVEGEHHATGSVVSIPWLIVLATLALIALIVLVTVRSIRMRRRLAAAEAALAQQPEQPEQAEPVLEPAP
ncbi:hypothetical protein [Microbacterium sp. YY-01]|uniref:hypothetical protein n=1 Tax=Microbacterium sp. YY-01 TaxID=3421634 RepID=UPI003D1826A8